MFGEKKHDFWVKHGFLLAKLSGAFVFLFGFLIVSVFEFPAGISTHPKKWVPLWDSHHGQEVL